jgi:transcriptional regulator NrdR family protein
MKENSYNKCPYCQKNTMDNGGYLQFGEYVKYRQCPKCGARFKNIYRLEYHGREIIIPPKERKDEE